MIVVCLNRPTLHQNCRSVWLMDKAASVPSCTTYSIVRMSKVSIFYTCERDAISALCYVQYFHKVLLG